MISSLQALRALAALSVVLFHSAAVMALPKYFGHDPVAGALSPGDSGVFLFFVLSGFIIAHAHVRDVGRPERLATYGWNRAARIYPMYWLVAAGVVVAELVLIGTLPESYGRPAFIAGLATLLPFAGAQGNLAVAWTLFHETMFYIVFASLILSARWGGMIFAGWALGCALGLVVGPPANPALQVLVSPLNLLFGCGICAWLAYTRWPIGRPLALLAAGCGAFALLWIGEALLQPAARSHFVVLGYGLASAAILVAAAVDERETGRQPPGWLILLGSASYSIYLVHFLFVSAAAKLALRLSLGPGLVSLAFIAGIGVAAGLVLHVAVERPLLRFLRARRPGARADVQAIPN